MAKLVDKSDIPTYAEYRKSKYGERRCYKPCGSTGCKPQRSEAVTTAILLFATLIIAGAALCLIFQRRLIFQTRPRSALPHVPLHTLGGENVCIETDDGELLTAWHKPPAGNGPLVIFFHGGADSPEQRAVRFIALLSSGYGVLAPYFRGYGQSTGTPNETGLFLDADAIYEFCRRQYRQEQLVLWGFSLGSAVAVDLASRRKVAALVLEAAFTSLADVAKRWIPFLPMQWLLRDRFKAIDTISAVTAPVLVIHGGADRDVPIDLAERLFDLAPYPKEFAKLEGGHHDDLDRYGAVTIVRRFLARAI